MVFFDLFGIGWRRAMRDLPAVAAKLGLRFIVSSDRRVIGRIEGDYQSRNVSIAPDNNALILFSVTGLPRMFLSTKVYEKKNNDLRSKVFNRFFRTRTTNRSEAVVQTIDNSGAALDLLPAFSRRWKRKLDFFEVSEDGIRLSLKYGMNSYVPAKDFE